MPNINTTNFSVAWNRNWRHALFIPLCTNGFFLLVWYNKLGIFHHIYWGAIDCNFQIKLLFLFLKIVLVFNNKHCVDSYEISHQAAFHLCLHCLPESLVYKGFSRTPDRDFHCFQWCEIILSHIPVPARGKDKNEQQQVGCTSIRDIVMLKWRHHVTSQRIQDFLFFMFFQYKMWYLVCLFVWFDSLRPLNNLSVMRDGSSWVEPVIS